MPGLITDLVLSLDDRWLYFSNWLHGDIRQYDVSDPAKPKLTGQVWLGGVLGKQRQAAWRPTSRAARRCCSSASTASGSTSPTRSSAVGTTSSIPTWPRRARTCSQLDCDTAKGGLTLNERFLVDFGKEPHGPARAHEIRFPGGDSTSDIWV